MRKVHANEPAAVTILISGFDAFGEAKVNSSQLVIEALAETEPEGVITAVLPTSYSEAEKRMQTLIRQHRPDRILMLGLASKAQAIRLEQVALNMNDCAAPDNDGEVRLSQRIAEDAPIGRWNSLPLSRMASIARQLGHAIEFSSDAGGFVCNHIFFTAAQMLAAEFPDSRCGFVHLPDISGSGEKLARTVELVQAWIADGLA
jgi:pyroglutamyl-peptidase